VGQCHFHPAQLGQPLQPPDGGIAGLAAAADVPRAGGVLGIGIGVLSGETVADGRPAVLSAARAIATVDPALAATPLLTPTPTVTPGPSATPTLAPSPTPNLSGPAPAARGATLRTLVLSSLAGGLVVLSAVALRSRRRGR